MWLWMALAQGADPESTPPVVEAVTWAQPFEVTEPMAYPMRADRPEVRQGWMLEVRVPPGSSRVQSIHSPVVYVGDWPSRRANLTSDGTCLALWVPGTVDWGATPIFFGPPIPPEKVSPEQAADAAAAAAEAGQIPEAPTWVASRLVLQDEAALMDALSKRCAVTTVPFDPSSQSGRTRRTRRTDVP